MKRTAVLLVGIAFGLCLLGLFAQNNLDPSGRLPPQKHTKIELTCEDYKAEAESARRREADSFMDRYRFSDIRITTYPDRRVLRADELMDLIDSHRKELGIDQISLMKVPARAFEPERLLFPQYVDDFTLSREQWNELQRRAKSNLEMSPWAHPDVVAHWKSIVAGKPPFGLKVRD